MKYYHVFLYIAFMAVLVSCKKENLPAVTVADNTSQQKLQSWFEQQNKLISSAVRPVLGSNEPDWGQTEYVASENLYLTPVITAKGRNVVKYFVAASNGKDEIKTGSYYIILTETGENKPYAENLIVNSIKEDVKKIGDFSGAILEYDLNSALLKSKHYKNGNEISKKDDLVYKTKGNAKEPKEIVVNNIASCAEGEEQVCIDWYWQTFINGVLYSEEYLFSTCSCTVNSGGGQTNTGGTSGCIMSVTEAQSILNQVNGTSVAATSNVLTLGAPVTSQPGKIRAPCSGYGGGYKLNIAFGMYIEWAAKYSGWGYRYPGIPNDPWKFESIKYNGFLKTEGSTTICIDTKVTTTHTETISADKKWAYTSGNCYIDVEVSCLGGVIRTSKVGYFGASFSAEAMVET